ncbi:MAG: MFS transporter [Acidobacteria bacterium 13_1_20CM_2_65_9]|nr:MAG: MFS transporter [Acidobacteria bacterium 13_1_20CM_2_65_9]
MSTIQPDARATRLTPLQWLIIIISAIGFAFDSYVLLMLPLIVRPALTELLHVPPSSPLINDWAGLIFYVPAMAGGIFGLLGGYFTDVFGRRRVLVWSILLYAFSAFASGYSTSVGWLLFWRCGTFVGVCVEFVAAVAWLSELFPNPKQREAIVGYTQTVGSIGGIMATAGYYLVVTYGHLLPAVRGGHEAWRYTLMSGVIPAIPLIIVRPFLPESPVWKQKKQAGTLKRPSFGELFGPQFKKTTIVTTVMMAAAYAAAFGAIQQTPRIVPGLPDVRTLPRPAIEQTVSVVQSFQEFGGLAGRILLAYLAVRIVSRRKLLRLFQVPGLVLVPIVFAVVATSSLTMLKWGIFLYGITTIGQFSFWGNYLPRVFPTYLRGTGESFAANVGGRMIGTSAALLTTQLANVMPGASAPTKLAYASALVGTAAYLLGLIASFWLPEPKREEHPD